MARKETLARIYEIKESIKALTAEKDDLVEYALDHQIYDEGDFYMNVVDNDTFTIELDAFRKAVGNKTFFEVASVSLTNARRVLGTDQLALVTTPLARNPKIYVKKKNVS